MNKKNFICRFLLLFLMAMCFLVPGALSQKLPNKQEISVRIPVDFIIDGKSTEWGNHYTAYNHATEVFYTIANDDERLYLIVHAEKPRIVYKVVEGGISFVLSNSIKKNEKDKTTILFPLMSMANCWKALHMAGLTIIENPRNLSGSDYMEPVTAGQISIEKANKELSAHLKEIKISGIADIKDTITNASWKTPYYRELPFRHHNFKIIPLNNKEGILANLRFNQTGGCTYEVSIPLKLLDLNINSTAKISYNVILNARGEDARIGDLQTFNSKGTPGNIDLESATNFSGEYVLAKKP